MSSTSFEPRAGWRWPEDIPVNVSSSSSATGDNATSATSEPQQTSTGDDSERKGPRPQKHYPPRQCRICLEVVLPTFKGLETASENVPRVFQPAPSVVYESEEGRMIRPCKCKGSSKFVHETCLQAWRHADPSYGPRNYWQCPTCGFRYRLERMRWGRWISSRVTQISLTILIFLAAVFLLGFVADPIINLYLDPLTTISSVPTGGHIDTLDTDDDELSWTFHFLKGLASLGLVGFAKYFFTLNPWHWFQIRNSGLIGGNARAGTTGRDRLANISWVVVMVGVATALYGVWTFVRGLSRRFLEKAGERVIDVQGDDGDNEAEATNDPAG